MSEQPEPYRLLFVCTANICRSAAAESIARARYGEANTLFRSAGFLESGRECPSLMVETLRSRGIEVAGHRSYQLDEASLRAADLVLTMEGEHVQKATLLDPDSFPRVVPLKEAAGLLEHANPSQVTVDELVTALNRERDPTTYLSTRFDVADPYGRKAKDYRRAVEEISALVDSVVGRLV